MVIAVFVLHTELWKKVWNLSIGEYSSVINKMMKKVYYNQSKKVMKGRAPAKIFEGLRKSEFNVPKRCRYDILISNECEHLR